MNKCKKNQQEVNPKDANYYFDGIVSLYQDLAINIDNYSDEQAKDIIEQLKRNSLHMFSLIKSDDELRLIITRFINELSGDDKLIKLQNALMELAKAKYYEMHPETMPNEESFNIEHQKEDLKRELERI